MLVKPNSLVIINPDALTYAVTGDTKVSLDRLVGLVLRVIEPKEDITKKINFDNSALYYIMTRRGCLSVFEFDLEVIDDKKEKSSY